jgi:hypothetical protein
LGGAILKKASRPLIVFEDGLNFRTQLFVLATERQKRRSMLGWKLKRLVKQRLDSLPVLRV